jgi:asparagine synthase (glutamine-hydrolysing)
MCGIAGIVGRIHEDNHRALERMNAAMAHRGPDGEGYWHSAQDERGWGVMLGHRRLAILDLSTAAAQPMLDPVTGQALVLNGEIYNYVELRRRMEAAGQTFNSSGDTAVMLRLLALSGPKAVEELRGMFAFAQWDPRERRLVMARDPLGIKPLYVARNSDPQKNWSLVFASEVRAILASGLLGKPRLKSRAVASFLWNGFAIAPDSMIDGVESLLPGEIRIYEGDGSPQSARSYWRMSTDSATPTTEADVTQALHESVRLHLASDVPLAVFLSGGLDSSALANLAARANAGPVHTFTLEFEETAYAEGQAARRIAGAIGTQHCEYLLTQDHFLQNLEAALNSLDQPTFDGVNSYFISKVVAEQGFKVALTGTGGDELFGGYSSFRRLPLLLRSAWMTKWLPKAVKVRLANLLLSLSHPPSPGAFPGQVSWAKLPDLAASAPDLIRLYQLTYALFVPRSQDDLLGGLAHETLMDGLTPDMHRLLENDIVGRSPPAAVSSIEHRLFLGEKLLRDTDAASMASSIEVRLPLVDRTVFEVVNGLPDGLRFQPMGKKTLLRRAGLKGLDPALFDRPKRGFEFPFDRWIRTELGAVMQDTMCDPVQVQSAGLNPVAVRQLWISFQRGAPGLYWTRIWAVFVLIRWCHRNHVYA